MLKRFSNFIRNQSSLILFSSIWILAAVSAFARNGWIPLDDKRLALPGEVELKLERRGDHLHEAVMRQKGKIVWSQVFELEYDRVWQYAFFVPIKKNFYYFDINKDGSPEVAIGTWDGGNHVQRDVLIFTVLRNELRYLEKMPFNLEYGEYVYQ